MAEDAPFRPERLRRRALSLSVRDLRGVREVVTDFLQGGEATDDTAEYHDRWGYLVRLIMMGLNRENGTLQILPQAGALLDQGFLTMQVAGIVQAMFIDHVNRKTEEMARVHAPARGKGR